MTRHRSNNVEPHVRIQDWFYWLLSRLTPQETKLYFALRFQAWRANGKRKNYISKSLHKIAHEIALPWATAGRAMQGLERKGFVVRRPNGIYLPELKLDGDPALFSHAFDTGFDTVGHERNKSEKCPNRAMGCPNGATIAQIDTTIAQIGHSTPNIHPNFQLLTGARNDLEKRSRETVGRNARDRPPLRGGRRAAVFNLRERGSDTMQKQAPDEIKKQIAELHKKMGWRQAPAGRGAEAQEEFEQGRRRELARQAEELEKGKSDAEALPDSDHDPRS